VKLFDPWADAPSHRDILHVFGLSRGALELVEAVRRRGAAVVISPILWYHFVSLAMAEVSWLRRVRLCCGFSARRIGLRIGDWKYRLLHQADLVLPNSRAEAAQLQRYFALPADRIRVVPNGVDASWLEGVALPWSERRGVLCVGRIEPRKNQLAVVRAVRDTELQLRLVGRPVPGHERYLERCLAEAKGNVEYLGAYRHRSVELAREFGRARAVVLASWFETPGLAALEGAVSGANVVVTTYGSAWEYFGSYAHYVHPQDVVGLRRALEAAHNTPPDPFLAEKVRCAFSWTRVAEELLQIYASLRSHEHGSVNRAARAA